MPEAQIINNWYRHNILLMKKYWFKIWHNIGPRQPAWVSWSAGALVLANMGDLSSSSECWLFFFQVYKSRFKQPLQSERQTQNMTWEVNQLALHSYLRGIPTERREKKRMREIWEECASFQTSRNLADQVRTMIKKKLVFWPWNTRILEYTRK